MDPHAPTMGLFFIHRTNQGHSCRNPPASMTGASHSAVGQVAENPVLTLITCGVANGQGSSPQLLLTDSPAHTVGSHSTSPLDSPSLNGSFVVGGSQMEPRYSLTRPFSSRASFLHHHYHLWYLPSTPPSLFFFAPNCPHLY